ncbi:CsbD family protein [Acidipila sp. EB88]|nr:CsbD family protein [Acidipila sp. EB88]
MWILGVTFLGATAYVLYSNQLTPGPQYAGDDVDEFGNNIGSWGTKQRVTGTGSKLGGKLKQGFGKLTGDEQTESEGYVDEAVGNIKDGVGQAAHAVSDAVSNLKS